ncbi:hypothetical protein KIL84_018310 [Mauremys mutica]|uniref:Uncharacterized protein n=1 Tax=Mauremys mutica TaxID=74926 RepID=A0A9D3XSW8_9SAUR|nr:hypothetical protein KIL84_018310 [Mauremys mutica]
MPSSRGRSHSHRDRFATPPPPVPTRHCPVPPPRPRCGWRSPWPAIGGCSSVTRRGRSLLGERRDCGLPAPGKGGPGARLSPWLPGSGSVSIRDAPLPPPPPPPPLLPSSPGWGGGWAHTSTPVLAMR